MKNENVSERGDQIGDKSENSERYALNKGDNSVNNVKTLNETFKDRRRSSRLEALDIKFKNPLEVSAIIE